MPTTTVLSALVVEFALEITEAEQQIIIPGKPQDITCKVTKVNVGGVRFPNFLWTFNIDNNEEIMKMVMDGIKQYLSIGRAQDTILRPPPAKPIPNLKKV